MQQYSGYLYCVITESPCLCLSCNVLFFAAVQPITYPIDDSLVLPDTASKKRPIPSFDFVLPMHCIGPLLMVWNFCISFARIIRLSPFSLDEIEKAMESKTEDHILLKEMHITLLHSALTCPVLRQLFVQKRRRKVNVRMY